MKLNTKTNHKPSLESIHTDMTELSTGRVNMQTDGRTAFQLYIIDDGVKKVAK